MENQNSNEHQSDEQKSPRTKPERLTEHIIKALQKEYMLIGKTSVKGWHAWLIIGLIAGITVGIVGVANRSGEFEKGKAAETSNACSTPFTLAPILQTIPYPDTDANYWIWGYTRNSNSANVAFKITGEFSYSRFFSFQSYAGNFSSSLLDKNINADSGSVNPFQAGANRYATKRFYTVYFVPNGTHVGEPNTIQMPPLSSSTDYPSLIMRILLSDKDQYIPLDHKTYGNAQGWVPLPTITAVSNSDLKTTVSCPSASKVSDMLSTLNQGADQQEFPPFPENPINFYHGFVSGTGGPSAAVGYLGAQIAPPSSGNIALIRFRIPTFPDTYNYPLQPFTGQEQLRYVAICVHNLITTATTECGRDDQLLRNQTNNGSAFTTIVIGPDPSSDPSVKTAADKKGYYYLSWKNINDQRIFLLYRQVLALDGWDGSVQQKVPVYSGELNTKYYHAQNRIGSYAPVGRVCKLTDFVNGTCDLKISPRQSM